MGRAGITNPSLPTAASERCHLLLLLLLPRRQIGRGGDLRRHVGVSLLKLLVEALGVLLPQLLNSNDLLLGLLLLGLLDECRILLGLLLSEHRVLQVLLLREHGVLLPQGEHGVLLLLLLHAHGLHLLLK